MDDRRNESPPILAEMTLPKADSLYCFTASLDPNEERDPSAPSEFHWQIIKCRMLLFSTPVLASPVQPISGPHRDVTVVCRREDIARGVPADDEDDDVAASEGASELQDELARLRLSVSRLRPVTDTEYAACLQYTLTARLSPLWNPLELDRLVRGRDFLCRGDSADSVRLEVHVRGREGVGWLGLAFCRLRVAPLALVADLDVAASALEAFHDDPQGVVPSTCVGEPWVHVLPSLKRGMVMEISKSLPEDCPFRSYKNIRRHWKNMYGYRLAEEPAGVAYCSVYFERMGGTRLSYPLACLTARRPSALRCLDPHAAALSFLADVATKVATVCGTPSPVVVAGLARPVAALSCAGEGAEGESRARPNLRPLSEEDSTPSTCPLSLATQAAQGEGTRTLVDWNFTKRASRPGDNKENEPPEDSGYDSSTQVRRPVFRARAPASRAAVEMPSAAWFNPAAVSTPRPAASSTATSPVPWSSPSASSVSGPAPTSPSSGCRTDDERHLTTPVFRIPVHKPIFLPRFTLATRAPARTPAKGRAGPAKGRAGPATASRPQGGASASTASWRSSPGASSPATPRKSGSVKRSSTEAPLAPELTSADAARRASVPALLAWLRGRGVPCRAKDKKAELVLKVIAALGDDASGH